MSTAGHKMSTDGHDFTKNIKFMKIKSKLRPDYSYEIPLKHNEIPAKINVETGEVKSVGKKRGKPNPDFQNFNLMNVYTRFNDKAWQLLKTQTTDSELKCALTLATMAKAYTNSLVPLNDDTTQSDLAEILGINRKTVNKHIDKLFRLGVIGKFEVFKADEIHTKYWVFNPYLAFNGDKIRIGVSTLFEGTHYHLVS